MTTTGRNNSWAPLLVIGLVVASVGIGGLVQSASGSPTDTAVNQDCWLTIRGDAPDPEELGAPSAEGAMTALQLELAASTDSARRGLVPPIDSVERLQLRAQQVSLAKPIASSEFAQSSLNTVPFQTKDRTGAITAEFVAELSSAGDWRVETQSYLVTPESCPAPK